MDSANMIEAMLSICVQIPLRFQCLVVLARSVVSRVPAGDRYDQLEIWRYLDYQKLLECIMSDFPMLRRGFCLKYDGYLARFNNRTSTRLRYVPLILTKDNFMIILEHAARDHEHRVLPLILHINPFLQYIVPNPSVVEESSDTPGSDVTISIAEPNQTIVAEHAVEHANMEATEHKGLANFNRDSASDDFESS